MTIKRQFKTIELKNGKTIRTVVFDDPQYALLTTFFIADYNAFSDWIDRNMLDVLEGRKEYLEISGNICELAIGKEMTTVYDTLAEDGIGRRCEVSTPELFDVMNEWKSCRTDC